MNTAVSCILLATRNVHKVVEIRSILGKGIVFLTLDDFPAAPTVIEDAATFAGNATKKALTLARFVGGHDHLFRRAHSAQVLADDSGLEVDALKGAPGVHSARFAALDSAGNSSDSANSAKLLGLLKGVPEPERTARFRCVLALTPILPAADAGSSQVCYSDEAELGAQLFDGTCEGRILFAPKGEAGFGYDPLFVPNGYQQSFAELGEDIKNRLSHRAVALQKLSRWLPQTRS